MLRLSLNGILARKVRLLLTTLSVVIGVGFIAGTFMFVDSITRAFDDIFMEAQAGVDLTVRNAKFDLSADPSSQGPGMQVEDPNAVRMDESVLGRIQATDGVDEAEGLVQGIAQLVKEDGDPISPPGPPTLGFSWGEREALSPLRIASGRAPARDGEVVIDVQSFEKGKFALGDDVQVLFGYGTRDERFRIVGTAGFGASNETQGATLAIFELQAAQRVFDAAGRLDAIGLSAQEGVNVAALKRELGQELGPKFELLTADESLAEQQASIGSALGYLRTAMLAFAGVALFVSAFTIFNTFSIIVAQRSREIGLLRALGATRRQVIGMVVTEGLVVGVVASLLGIGAGYGIAYGLRALLIAFGIDLPQSGLPLLPRTVGAALLIGIGVTLLASIVPAVRASRVAPMEALREGTSREGARMRARVLALGTIVLLAGIGALGYGMFGGVNGYVRALSSLGAGFVLIIVGAAVLAPLVVRPAVTVIGAPFRSTTSRLAKRNATRNPRRTSSTAAALMIGLGLATFAGIFTSSVSETTFNQIDKAFGADYLLSNKSQGSGIDPKVAGTVAEVDGVTAVVGAEHGPVTTKDGDQQPLLGVNPEDLRKVVNYDVIDGSIDDLDRDRTVLVSDRVATEQGLEAGDKVTLKVAKQELEVTIAAVYRDIGLNITWVGSREVFAELFPENRRYDFYVFVNQDDEVDAGDVRKDLDAALEPTPYVQVQDQAEFKQSIRNQVNQLLGLLFGLLALSLVIALFGIVNTLALSVLERTREIGLIRAVGGSRRQIRRIVRLEAVIVSVLGAILGVVLGLSLGAAAVGALADEGLELSIPVVLILAMLVVGALAGVVAAILPARRAAKLDVLRAIASE